MSSVESSSSAAAKAAADSSSGSAKKNLHFDYKKVLNLNTTNASLAKMAEDLASSPNKNDLDMAMFSYYLSERTNAVMALSNVLRVIGDTIGRIIQNIRA